MNYEKRYVLIKDEQDLVSGFVKIEKDGKLKINYNLSVFSFFIDLYVVFDNKIIKQFTNILPAGSKIFNFNDVNLGFVFKTDKNLYTAGTVPFAMQQKLRNEIFNGDDIISSVVHRIFTIKQEFTFIEKISKPINELFNCLEKKLAIVNGRNLYYVEICENNMVSIVGKLYDDRDSLIAIGVGSKIKNNNIVGSNRLIQSEVGDYLLMEFYDVRYGNRLLCY